MWVCGFTFVLIQGIMTVNSCTYLSIVAVVAKTLTVDLKCL